MNRLDYHCYVCGCTLFGAARVTGLCQSCWFKHDYFADDTAVYASRAAQEVRAHNVRSSKEHIRQMGLWDIEEANDDI